MGNLCGRVGLDGGRVDLGPRAVSGAAGTLSVAFDGRLDNRGDLRAALRGAEGAPDAELALLAYEAWGDSFPARLIGDFAFALWDGPRRRLFCARDPLGLRPFFYRLHGGAFSFASDLATLLGDDLPEPNEGFIAELLADRATDLEETLFRGVLRLPPAHLLSVTAGARQLLRSWDIDTARTVHHRSDADYAEHFLEVLREAIRCRLLDGPVAAHLSGGLDSSSVVSLAAALGHPLETFSLVFPDVPAADERTFIDDVVRKWNVPSHRLAPALPGPDETIERARETLDLPDYPNGVAWEPIRETMRDAGFRACLTGIGGDHWLTGQAEHAADLVRKLRLGEAIRAARRPGALLRHGLWPLLPRPLRCAVRRIGRAPDWIPRSFARRTSLMDRIVRSALRDGPSLARERLRAQLTSGTQVLATELEARAAARSGVEHRHPFYDRRLVELAIALPEEQRRRDGVEKFVLREAMRGILPESIRQRRTKGDFGHLFAEAFRRHGGERFFSSLTIAERGWVDGARAAEMYRRFLEDEGHLWPLAMIWCVETWHRALFAARPDRLKSPAVSGKVNT